MKYFGIILLIFGNCFAIDDDDVFYPPQFDSSETSERVVGGSDAPNGIAPYQISLQYLSRSHKCGGSLISDKWILTAAHCVVNSTPAETLVLTGTQNLKKGGEYYQPDFIKYHPNYNQPSYHNDIALIRLKESVKLNNVTQIIECDKNELPDDCTLTLTGWGRLKFNGAIPDALQILNLKYVNYPNCKSAHFNSPYVGEGHVCTFNKYGEGSCNGDSGGPLVYNGKLVALVNWGRKCAKGFPDVHASVSYYYDFITKVMAENP